MFLTGKGRFGHVILLVKFKGSNWKQLFMCLPNTTFTNGAFNQNYVLVTFFGHLSINIWLCFIGEGPTSTSESVPQSQKKQGSEVNEGKFYILNLYK